MSAFGIASLACVFGSDVERDSDGAVTTLTHRFGEEDFLRGHFPGFPVVPGVILLDGMMLAALHGVGDAVVIHAVAIEAVTFHRPVLPGSPARFTARIVKREAGSVCVRCAVMVGGVRHARAGMTLRLEPTRS